MKSIDTVRHRRKQFAVLARARHAQAATMTLAPGATSDEDSANEHAWAEQWPRQPPNSQGPVGYLVQAVEEIVAGREFSTCYPDMPIEIRFRPHGDRVTISLASRKRDAEADVSIDELCKVMASAGVLFFSKLRPFVTSDQLVCDQYIARLDGLAEGRRDSSRQ